MPPSFPPQPQIFHLFPHLPLELRTEIWSLSLPPPRLIHIRTERGEIHLPGRHPNQPFIHVWVTKKLPVPSLLHTCRDARAVALKHYELAFDTNCRPAKEDLPALHDLPGIRRGRELAFPFERKALMYVDLERDYFVTSHNRLSPRAPRGGWPKDEMADPSFAAWPVQKGRFKVEIFREVVPAEVFSRIQNFAARFMYSLNEIFDRRGGSGMVAGRRVLVVRDPFEKDERGQFFIDALGGLGGGKVPRLSRKGRVRSLVNLEELERAVSEGMVWGWVVDKENDERMMEREVEAEAAGD
ncbi:hypothetical protein BKA65DRAFT_206491 [Rhexocercosporidium sp. MPI-PUGE-AT-0058]|nr:hypothetical protein BKA65DRAFT_206491 [Rhexocercosporidium sp. MPI-PUGE-AT-0058]